MKIGFAITSSFCLINEVIVQIDNLTQAGYDVYAIASPAVLEIDTRFTKSEDIKQKLEKMTNKKIVSTIVDAEKFGPAEPLDALIVAPATGNFIAKLAHGITDNPVSMATKATMRNNSPIIIAMATNDGLGLNGENVMKLLNTKGIYFVPFYQDDYINKSKSLIADFDLLIPTLKSALNNQQFQPVIQHQAIVRTRTKKS